MSKVLRIGLWGVVLWLALFNFTNFKDYYLSLTQPTATGWQDEGYVLAPALKVYEGGYRGFRCRDQNLTYCYGSSQAFLDGGLLKAMSTKWLKEGEIIKAPGNPWFYQTQFPRVLETLRLSRLFYALVLMSFIFIVAFRAGFGDLGSSLIALSFGFLSAFLHSRQGLKNDFPGALVLVLFAASTQQALLYFRTSRGEIFWFLSLFLGIFGLGIRFPIVVPLGLFVLAIALMGLIGKEGLAAFFKSLLWSFFWCAVFYLVLNPNFRISLGEATWWNVYLEKKTPLGWARIKSELLGVTRDSIPIIAGALFLSMLSLVVKIRASRAYLVDLLTDCFFSVSLLLLTLPVVRAAWARPAYYLPVAAWGFMFLLFKAKELRFRGSLLSLVAKGTLVVVCGFAVCLNVNLDLFGETTSRLKSLIQWTAPLSAGSELTKKIEEPLTANAYWALDWNLKPEIEKTRMDESKVIFFDSLSESPKALKEKMERRWGSKIFDAERAPYIAVACWRRKNLASEDALERSPSAIEWTKFTNLRCTNFTEIGFGAINSFELGTRVGHFWVGNWFDLLPVEKELELPVLEIGRSPFSPRMLGNAIEGQDHWYAPLVLLRPTVLNGVFRVDSEKLDQIKTVRIGLESNCKRESGLKLSLTRDGEFYAEGLRDLNISADFCSRLKPVCWLGLQEWWNKRESLQDWVVSVRGASPKRNKSSAVLAINLESSGLHPTYCRASIKRIYFGTIQSMN